MTATTPQPETIPERDRYRIGMAASHLESALVALRYAAEQPLRAPLLWEVARVSLIHARGYLGAYGFEHGRRS